MLDECHLSFTASDYRPKLRQLGHLQVLRCPMILLTATLPPSRLDELREVMHISDFRLIRMSTVRPNIRYAVRRCPNQSAMKVVREMARLRGLGKGERGIFYCSSRDRTEEVGQILNYPSYYSMVEEKDAAVEKWLQGEGFIAATGALGSGGDYPGIVYIVHIRVPYGMIDFAQETGRGGRAGEDLDLIILLEDLEYQRLNKQDAAELTVDELAMQRFIETRDCRRFTMSGYLDEEGQSCDEVGGRLCDCCGGGVSDWTASQVRTAKEVQQSEDKMNEVQRHCVFCWVRYGAERAHHSSGRCTFTQGLSIEQSESLRKGVRLDRRCRDCWKCGISQQICKSVENEGACQWNGVAACLWLGWFTFPGAQEVLIRGGYSGVNIAVYQKWLGLRARQKVQGGIVSNGMWLLWTMLQREQSSKSRPDHIGVEEGSAIDKVAVLLPVIIATPNATVPIIPSSPLAGLSRRERVIKWLSQHCIYCEVTEAPQSYSTHWYRTCYRSKGMADKLGYKESVEWQMGMDQVREGICQWCSKPIGQCGRRWSINITCVYCDIVLPALFILHERRWIKQWLIREGYDVGFGIGQLQRWLNESSSRGG